MKTIKRIIAIVLLIVTVLLACYMCKTCGRLKDTDNTLENYQNTSFYTENAKITLTILEDYSAKYLYNDSEISLTFNDFSDGVLEFISEEKAYSFVVIDNDKLFDISSKKLLKRSKYYEEENSV